MLLSAGQDLTMRELEFKSIAGGVVICSGEDVVFNWQSSALGEKSDFCRNRRIIRCVEVTFGGVNVAFVKRW